MEGTNNKESIPNIVIESQPNSYSLLDDDFDCLFEIYESDIASYERVKEISEDVQRHQFYLNKRFHFRFQQAQEVLSRSKLLIERHRKFFRNVNIPFESITKTIKEIIDAPEPKLVNEDQNDETNLNIPENGRHGSVVSDFSEFKANLSEYYERVETELIEDFQSFKNYIEKEYPHRIISYRSSLQGIHSHVKEMRDQFRIYTNNSQLILEEIQQKVNYQKQLVTDLRRLLDRQREEGLIDDEDEEIEDEGEENDEIDDDDDEYSLLLLGGTFEKENNVEESEEESDINFRKLIRTKHDEVHALSSRLTLDGSVFINKYLRPQESLLHDLQHSVCEFTDSLEPFFEIPYHLKFFVSIHDVYLTVLDERKRRETFVKEYQDFLLERHQIEDETDRNHLWSVFVPLLRIPNEVIVSSHDNFGENLINSPIRQTDNNKKKKGDDDESNSNNTADLEDDSTGITSSTTHISTSEDGTSNVSNNNNNSTHGGRRININNLSPQPQHHQLQQQQPFPFNILPPSNVSDFNHSESESDVLSVSDIETYMTAILSKKKTIGVQTNYSVVLPRPTSSFHQSFISHSSPQQQERRKKEQQEQKERKEKKQDEEEQQHHQQIIAQLEQEEDELIHMEIRRENAKMTREKELMERKIRDKDQEKKRHLYHLSRISSENMKLRRQLHKMSNSENLHLFQLKKKVFLLQKKIRDLQSSTSAISSIPTVINNNDEKRKKKKKKKKQKKNDDKEEEEAEEEEEEEEQKKEEEVFSKEKLKFFGKLEVGDFVLCKKNEKEKKWKIVWEGNDISSNDNKNKEQTAINNNDFYIGGNIGMIGRNHKLIYGVVGEIYAKRANFGVGKKKRFIKEVWLKKVIFPKNQVESYL